MWSTAPERLTVDLRCPALKMATGNIRADSGFARPRPREKSHARTHARHSPRAATCVRARARGHRFMPISAPAGFDIRGYAGILCPLPSLSRWLRGYGARFDERKTLEESEGDGDLTRTERSEREAMKATRRFGEIASAFKLAAALMLEHGRLRLSSEMGQGERRRVGRHLNGRGNLGGTAPAA